MPILLLSIGIFSVILCGVALTLSTHFCGLLKNAIVNTFISKQLVNFECHHFSPVEFKNFYLLL